MVTKNLLVELFVEELPPKDLKKLGASFASVLAESLKAQGLSTEHSAVTPYASPRRLAVHVSAVRAQADERAQSLKLVPVSVGLNAEGQPTPALLKKLASVGADASVVPQLQRRQDGKAEALFYDSIVPGVSLADGLQKALDETLAALPIRKVMQYQLEDGWSSVNFVRPAHGLVALHGADVVPITTLGLHSGRETHGHRFEARIDPIVLQDADHYAKQLEDQGAVIASFEARHGEIVRQLKHAAPAGFAPIEDAALLDEVTSLVERPNVLLCEFEPEFLDVPQECLILTMKANQKYFPLLDAKGKLSNKFLVVSNIRPEDPRRVIEGNERVVRPRLADAKFFFDQDRKKTLESRVPGLNKVVYHGKLGTQGERVQRLRAIAQLIGEQLGGLRLAGDAEQAAHLAKADLLTEMVGEFPELQGVMGGYYARHDGVPDAVAIAIEDHYKPRFAGDELPRNVTGVVVALADKLETLVGMFGVGQLPTGDKDPFALRRHALGVIRLLGSLKSPASIDLDFLLKGAIDAFPSGLLNLEFQEDRTLVVPLWLKVQFFVQERALAFIKEMGYSQPEAEAVIQLSQPSEYGARLGAIRKTKTLFANELAQLANADKRARNILLKSGGASEFLSTSESLLTESAEKELLEKTRELRARVDVLVKAGNFEEALLVTVRISKPVTSFFDQVMVNAEDEATRLNRFRLLHEVVGLTNRVADLSKLAT